VLHHENQHFRAWQHIYGGVFSHADTDNPTGWIPQVTMRTLQISQQIQDKYTLKDQILCDVEIWVERAFFVLKTTVFTELLNDKYSMMLKRQYILYISIINSSMP
jgi:hypothetical protein